MHPLVKWLLWVFVAQLLLINVCAVVYAHKLTYFYEPAPNPTQGASRNVFLKTWKLFTGPKFRKTPDDEFPHFPFETIRFQTKSNISIEGWFMPVDSAKGTVILVHGLGVNKSILLQQAYEFRFFGFNAMLIDLRAHGNSGGNITTLGSRESEEVRLAYEFAAARGEKNIILYGVSMGAVAIAKAVSDFDLNPAGMILELPYDKLERVFGKRGQMLGFPAEPFGALITFWASVERGFNGFRQNTSRFAENIRCRTLLQYGVSDNLVSVADIKRIFRHLASPSKKLVAYENAGHDFLLTKDPVKWRREVGEFLSQ